MTLKNAQEKEKGEAQEATQQRNIALIAGGPRREARMGESGGLAWSVTFLGAGRCRGPSAQETLESEHIELCRLESRGPWPEAVCSL